MQNTRYLAVLIGLVLTACAAACGGGDDAADTCSGNACDGADAAIDDVEASDALNDAQPEQDSDPTGDVSDGGSDSSLDAEADGDDGPDVPDLDTAEDAPMDAADTPDDDVDVRDAVETTSDATPDVPEFTDWPEIDPIPETLGFRLIDAGALSRHTGTSPDADPRTTGYGYGLAPLDVDGDEDLDLFVGNVLGSLSRACVYENVSRFGQPYFRQRDDWCAREGAVYPSATGVDSNRDGRHELVVSNGSALIFVDVAAGWLEQRLDSPSGRCNVGSILPFDVDRDGHLDLIAPCIVAFDGDRILPSVPSDEWVWTERRGVWARAETRVFAVDENALGVGVLDANQDGLLDLLTVVDTFSSPNGINVTVEPGGWHLRCAVDEECATRRSPLGEAGDAWGSFMGLDVAELRGRQVVILGDLGPPGVFEWADNGSRSVDPGWDEEFFGNEERGFAFSWGIVPDDFDDDGDDDLIATFGPFARGTASEILTVADTHFQQSESGWSPAPREFRLPSPTSIGDERRSRAAIRFDADRDGIPEIFLATSNGAPAVYQHTGVERCTLRPSPTTVATWGAGYRVSADRENWRSLQPHGELFSSDGPWLLVRELQGWLQFPSGVVRRYDCGEARSINLEEPDWVRWSRDGDDVLITLSEPSWPEPVAAVSAYLEIEREEGVQRVVGQDLGDGVWRLAGVTEAVLSLQLEINGRFIDRRFDTRDIASE